MERQREGGEAPPAGAEGKNLLGRTGRCATDLSGAPGQREGLGVPMPLGG